ncbi:MAG TPA: 23S rRNA (pseudouridine(1915)-N(3))-methyltransferase RlmH [Myxococcales bacterium]|nr:23S rRNA (pseudouridine(1915)-N(3))-methyltransferase RlmH [Myxococcales bacterium]
MKVRVLSIGKDRKGRFEPLIQDYAGRLSRQLTFELVVAGEARGDDAAARRAEADLLRRRLRDRDLVVALDERGEAPTSEGLAARLREAERSGGRDLAFLVGGPGGLDPSLLADASWKLSLSRLTLPHQLARLVLVEQLYRALTILRGEPYHK